MTLSCEDPIMPKSDLYISPDKSELARLSRLAGSQARIMADSGDADDRANAAAYALLADAWQSLFEGTRDPAGAVAMLRAAAELGDVDPAAIEAAITQMEDVLLRGYKDTLGSVPVAMPGVASPPRDPPAPEVARPMTMLDVLRLKAEMGQPVGEAPELVPRGPEDQERFDRSLAIRQALHGGGGRRPGR
jgi:hypothetical protein